MEVHTVSVFSSNWPYLLKLFCNRHNFFHRISASNQCSHLKIGRVRSFETFEQLINTECRNLCYKHDNLNGILKYVCMWVMEHCFHVLKEMFVCVCFVSNWTEGQFVACSCQLCPYAASVLVFFHCVLGSHLNIFWLWWQNQFSLTVVLNVLYTTEAGFIYLHVIPPVGGHPEWRRYDSVHSWWIEQELACVWLVYIHFENEILELHFFFTLVHNCIQNCGKSAVG